MDIFDSNTFFGFARDERKDFSLGALHAMLASNGVARAIAYSLRGVHYDFREGNDETLAAAQQGGWLTPAATINPCRHLGCREEVERMRAAGVKAFRFFPDLQGWPLGFLPMRNLLLEIERLGGIAFLPATENGAATGILRLAEGLSLPVVMVGANFSNLGEAIACLLAAPNLYLDTQDLVTPMALEVIAQEVDVRRVIFGSKAPERHVKAVLNVVVNSTLGQQDKARVLSGNLVRLLEAVR